MLWRELGVLIEPFYSKSDNGCPPVGQERMLRSHCLRHWFNLSDRAAEEALYDTKWPKYRKVRYFSRWYHTH